MIPDFNTIWKSKRAILEGVANSIIKTKAVEDVAKLRLSICSECPHKSTDCAAMIKMCCSLCGCSLEMKSRSMKSSCPANFWPALEK
jgi:hypothetical protein